MNRTTPEFVQRVARLYVAAVKAGDSTSATVFAHAHNISHTALYKVADAPPLAELEDACARWGFDGAAEEYDVTEERVREWLRAYGELAEGKPR